MFSLDMNRHLWKDEEIFERYFNVLLALNKGVVDQMDNPKFFLDIANKLDVIMTQYETLDRSIQDPIFFWSFATANALFLLLGKKFDELGSTRIAYIINGYKEGLYKHEAHPSFPPIYIDKAFEHMSIFAEGQDIAWLENNRQKFIPIDA